MTLPHPNTWSCWMSSCDCGPGYPSAVISKLGEDRRKDMRNMMTDVVVQFDEMAIREETPRDKNPSGVMSNLRTPKLRRMRWSVL
jgi:hypothetical protein